MCDTWMTIEAAIFRRLRQRHQQRRFRQRQPLRLLAEIGNRSGTNALEVTAERRQRQIQIENLVLVELPLDLQRANHLAQLGIAGTLPPRADHTWQFQSDGGHARHLVTTCDKLKTHAAYAE